jgi:osmotically-inducible protein OsmY
MKPDDEIKRDVEAELKWSPQIKDADIAVKVHDGAVTLSGFTGTYFEKFQAKIVCRRVSGVAAIVDHIQVKPTTGAPTDAEIEQAARTALNVALPFACEQIVPTVRQGRIALNGSVEWQFQREAAESAVHHLHGVLSVQNLIRITPRAAAENIKHRIEDAFRRIAEVDAKHITVDADGSEVTLRGEVRSWTERDHAQQTAWSAPGVTHVNNALTVRT